VGGAPICRPVIGSRRYSFASTTHDENQPAHLKVLDPSICATKCAKEFGNPCERFCPANVYEMVDDGQGGKRLQINAANCVHCKAAISKIPTRSSIGRRPRVDRGPIIISVANPSRLLNWQAVNSVYV